MRTPGPRRRMVHGFLLTEGIIASPEDVRVVRYCDGVDADGANTYTSSTSTWPPRCPTRQPRGARVPHHSACGVCGKASCSKRGRGADLTLFRQRARGHRDRAGVDAPTLRKGPRVRGDRRPPRGRGVHRRRHAARPSARTSGATVGRQGARLGAHRSRVPASDTVLSSADARPFELRRRPRCRTSRSSPRFRPVVAGRRPGPRPRDDPRRLLARRSMNVYSGEQRIKI